MPLTDSVLRNLAATGKTFRVTDERGLYVEVSGKGSRLFRWKYRFAGKEKRLALGVYPEVSLKQARLKRDAARQQLAEGHDPAVERKLARLRTLQKSANSFEAVAEEWRRKNSPTWSKTYHDHIEHRLRDYVYPQVGARPIADITPMELLAAMRKVEVRSLEVAHRTLRVCGQVFRYAVATGRCLQEPVSGLRGALPPFRNGHFAATLEPKRLGTILRMLDSYPGGPTVHAAVRLAPLLFVRPGELRHAEWESVDLEEAEWRFTVPKTRTELIVPLATQAVEILSELHKHTGRGRFVFPSARGGQRPMSEAAVLNAMRSLQISKVEMSGHGFRAIARTLLDEQLGFRPELIEHQLAHTVRDPLGRAYNRTTYLAERKKMMQSWADHLDALKRRSELAVFCKRA